MAFRRTALVAATALALAGGTLVAPLSAQADDGDGDGIPTVATITGQVTLAPGYLLVPIVSVYDSAFNDIADVAVNPDGSYAVDIEATGTYEVAFVDNQDVSMPTRFFPDVLTDDPTTPGIIPLVVDGTQPIIPNVNGTIAPAAFPDAAAPKVVGGHEFGETVLVDPGQDDWDESPDVTYQWFRNGVGIAGATDVDYTLTAADMGKSIYIAATSSAYGYITTTLNSTPFIVKANKLKGGPKPKVTGTVKVGKRVTADHGTWTVKNVKFKYQWLANGVAIKKATKSSFKITKALKGKKLSVAVTIYKLDLGSLTKTTKAVKVK